MVQTQNSSKWLSCLKWLARGPNFDVITWSRYDINNFSFYTITEDHKSIMQNSGVTLEAESMHFASSKDNNPVIATISYYRIIEEILKVDYDKYRVPVFKCKWVDSNTGVHVDDFGFTLVDLAKIGYIRKILSSWLTKQNKFFMSKILLMKGGQLLYKGELNMILRTMTTQ